MPTIPTIPTIPYKTLCKLMTSEVIEALVNLLNIKKELPSITEFLLTTSIVECKTDTSGMMEKVRTYKSRKDTEERILKKAVGNKDFMKVLKVLESIPLELLKELCTLKDASDTSVALDDLQDRLKNNCVIFEETETN